MEALIFLFLLSAHVVHGSIREEPLHQCSRFDYEYKVLERLVHLEQKADMFENKYKELEGIVEEQNREIRRLHDTVQSKTVFAEIRLPIKKTFPAGATIIFTDPVVNTGNVYHTDFGFFQPTVNGTYSFSAKICTDQNTWMVFGLTLDGVVIEETIVGDSDWHQCGTSSMVNYVTTANKISVKLLHTKNGVIDKDFGISSFSGVLLNTYSP